MFSATICGAYRMQANWQIQIFPPLPDTQHMRLFVNSARSVKRDRFSKWTFSCEISVGVMGKPKARRKGKKAGGRAKATSPEDKIVKAAHADKGKGIRQKMVQLGTNH